MQRKFRWAALGLVLVPAVVGGFMLQSRSQQQGAAGARLFDDVLAHVTNDAVEPQPVDSLYAEAARGILAGLKDPYADLFSPQDLAEFQRQSLGNAYGGIGMQIEDQQGAITVTKVFHNTPAEHGGVQPGDRIVAVDSNAVVGWKLKQVSDSLIGPPGTQVNVAFRRLGVSAPIQSTFTRAIVHVPAVPYALMLKGDVGYIPLQRFNDTSGREVARAVMDLSQRGARSFILDLRGDPGGALDQALAVGDIFLPKGKEILSVRYRNQPTDTYSSDHAPLVPRAPLVVMANGYTASAAEIVTGALQDHDRALVVGTRTFGKGLVQSVFPLRGGWALKITTGRWYTPAGRSIQRNHHFKGDEGGVDTPLEPTDSAGPLPQYHSDAGRIIYGGGGITPDVVVKADTLSTAEQKLTHALGQHAQEAYVALYDMALQMKDSVKPSFEVTAALRQEYYRRLKKAGVDIDPELWNGGRRLIDRMIEQRVAALAFGDSTAFRRQMRYDNQLQTALDYLHGSRTQAQLFAQADKQQNPTP